MNQKFLSAIIVILVIICVSMGYYAIRERNEKIALSTQLVSLQQKSEKAMPQGMQGGKKPAPAMVLKGKKFSDNPLYSKAYLIFPTNGQLSSDAQTALTGWSVTTTANADGSTQVDLTPKEAEDVKQSFTVKPGYKLYFIEMTLVDDIAGIDENRGDDIGVLVDQDGIVQ